MPLDPPAPHAHAPEEPPHEHERFEWDEWAQESAELPPRPRRRLLGAGGNPRQLALLGVLLLACGFIGGVLVEKGQTSPSGAGGSVSGLASRFAALPGARAGSAPAR